MLWLHEDQAKCGGCGEFLDESTAPPAPNQWIAEPIVCHGCAAREMAASKELPNGGKTPAGTKFRTVNRG